MKLETIRVYKGKIVVKTGLHIGAGDVEMRIGGTDNPVIKHPYTGEPYIPGSSIKGKVRFLLEMKSGILAKRSSKNGDPLSYKDLKDLNLNKEEKRFGERILKLFGGSGGEQEERFLPARVAFRDCYISESCRREFKEKGRPFTEIKVENRIDRLRGTAENPRHTERVVEGVEFDFEVVLRVFEEDRNDQLEELLLEGLKLLEMDCLGGSGSRGYGKIEIVFEEESLNQKFKNLQIK